MGIETPETDEFLIYLPCCWVFGTSAADLVSKYAKKCGYGFTVRAESKPPKDNPSLTVQTFKDEISSGDYGFVYINGHGASNGIAVESYTHKYHTRGDNCPANAWAGDAYRQHLRNGFSATDLCGGPVSSRDGHHISVSGQAITRWFKDKKTIVVMDTCYSGSLVGAWHSREALGHSALCYPKAAVETKTFIQRLAGVIDRNGPNQRRVVPDARRGLGLQHRGADSTILAPVVMSHAPTGIIKARVEVPGFVTFDGKMDMSRDAKDVVLISSNADFVKEPQWTGPRRIDFSIMSRSGGPVKLTVKASEAISDNNQVRLDGNQEPSLNESGVAPNGDDFIWKVFGIDYGALTQPLHNAERKGVGLRPSDSPLG